MTEYFDEDDIFKLECECVKLDSKALTASTRPGAALIIFGIYMHAKTFKILIKSNCPRSKEKQIHEINWDCLQQITISKNPSVHEISMVLDKEMNGYALCVIAGKPADFERMYEVLNVVFFHLMNKRFKSNCSQVCRNIRCLSALEEMRSCQIGEGPDAIVYEPPLNQLIDNMLTKFENLNRRPGSAPVQPKPIVRNTSLEQVVTVNLMPEEDAEPEDEDNEASASENNVASVPESNVTSAPESNITTAPESNVASAPESNMASEPKSNVASESESNVASAPGGKVDSASKDGVNPEPEATDFFDMYEILNVPSVVVIFVTLIVNLIYFLLFSRDI